MPQAPRSSSAMEARAPTATGMRSRKLCGEGRGERIWLQGELVGAGLARVYSFPVIMPA